jgi:hypothetical protein
LETATGDGVTTTAILAKLERGAATDHLLSALRAGEWNERIDRDVRLALKSGKLIRVVNGRVSYAKPVPPPKDTPLAPSVITPDPPEKRCARCEVVKPIEEYHRAGVGRNRRGTCHECYKAKKREWQRQHNTRKCGGCGKVRILSRFGLEKTCFNCREAA